MHRLSSLPRIIILFEALQGELETCQRIVHCIRIDHGEITETMITAEVRKCRHEMPSKLTNCLISHLRAGGRMDVKYIFDVFGSKFRMDNLMAMSFQSEQGSNNFNLASSPLDKVRLACVKIW